MKKQVIGLNWLKCIINSFYHRKRIPNGKALKCISKYLGLHNIINNEEKNLKVFGLLHHWFDTE